MSFGGVSRRLFLGAVAFATLAGCRPQAMEPAAPVMVFAASSLQDVLTEAGEAYTAAGHGEVRFSFGGTPALARQIEQGAPADVFVSADEDWMNYVAERSLIDLESRVDLLGNRLVLIAPVGAQNALSLEPGLDLTTALGAEGRLAMAAPDVPAGKYAQAALESLGAWAGVEDRLARSENVRGALQFVSRGEAALGIVYQTDAQAEPGVQALGVFPAGTHPPIIYPAAAIKGRGPEARAFIDWLQGPEGRALFQRYGFSRP